MGLYSKSTSLNQWEAKDRRIYRKHENFNLQKKEELRLQVHGRFELSNFNSFAC